MYKRSPIQKIADMNQNQKSVARFDGKSSHNAALWKAAIKWPIYSVALMPLLLGTGWLISTKQNVRFDQFIGFLIASILFLLWENITNDLFDSHTGVDKYNKPHSIVALIGNKKSVIIALFVISFAFFCLIDLALKSNISVLYIVSTSLFLGYLYQGPPFRLGYKGLGEILSWIAFGPLATAAGLLVLSPPTTNQSIPWEDALILGSGPALATSLVLFCSHFHQIKEDRLHGKMSPVVRLGTKKSAALIPWILAIILILEIIPILKGIWPLSCLLGLTGLPAGIKLNKLLRDHHNHPNKIFESKFLALRFQFLNGFGLSLGFAIAPFVGIS